jgi:hypothetical protein
VATAIHPQQPKAVEAPVEAFRFATDFTPGTAGTDGTVPFTALARTGNAVEHWYWGSCVHDFAGMSAAAVIPVDYAHRDDEALGLINKSAVVPDGLQLSGLLTPFVDDDKATEVIFKSGKGVPYQASIFFDPYSCVVEDVPAGFTTEVNGQTFAGPVTVFRQWELRGLALCLYGVDPGTGLGFSRDLSGKTIAVNRFTKGGKMSTKTPAKPASTKPAKAVGKFADGDTEETDEEKKKKADDAAASEGENSAEEGSDEEEASEGVEEADAEGDDKTKKKTDGEADTKMSRKQLGQKFITAFGDTHGPKLFAEGCSFSEASSKYVKIVEAENKTLREANAKFSKGQTGTDPVSFGGSNKPVVPTKFSHLGNFGRIAAGITLPGALTKK